MSQPPHTLAETGVLATLRVMRAAADELAAAEVWAMSDDDIAAALEQGRGIQAIMTSVELALVAEADRRNVGAGAATSTAGWLRGRLRLHPGEANRAVGLAAALRNDCAATGAALATGRVSSHQAAVISEAIADLPPVDAPTKARAEAFLIEQAAVLDPVLLARAARALREALTTVPDSDQRLMRQHQRRELNRVVAADGMVRWSGWLDPAADATVWAAIGPLAAPRPASETGPDPRSAGQRRADALVDLARIGLASAELPASGGVRPTVTVTVALDALTAASARPGLLPTGEALTAAAARRIACDSRVIPVVLGGAGQPLDVGRAMRTVPAGIHTALVVRDQACAFPACDRLAAWCEAHHIRHWASGGDTALHNLVLLCSEHHKAVHHNGWRVRIDDDGVPTFRPPPWIDPDQLPRSHHRYALRRSCLVAGGHDPPPT
ncbi:MAG: DUF222 domain-containing protein [Mycobacteriales bacterium]